MQAATLASEHATRARSGWIISPRADLVWVMLPVVTGYLCLYAHVWLGVSSWLIWWFWSVAFNGPHFYATISRTYLDRHERRERRALLIGSLAWLAVGPACILVSILTGSRGLFPAFWLMQLLWAYFHVVRQHYGFLVLYQRRHGEAAGSSNRRDYWFFHVAMFGLVAALLLRHPDLRQDFGVGWRYSSVETAIIDWSLPFMGVVATVYLLSEMARYARTRRLNVPKLLLLATYLPFHAVLLMYPTVSGSFDYLLVQAAFTMPHNLQYMAIVWFYNRNRFGADVDGREFGLASIANKSVLRFTGAAVLASIVLFYSRWYFEGADVPFLPVRFTGADVALGQGFRLSDLVAAFWVGVVFHHQYLDQKIWKVSRDPELRADLRLGA